MAVGVLEELDQDRSRLTLPRQRYAQFSRDAGLKTQYERTEVAGFGARSLDKQAKSGIIEPNRSKEIPEVGKTSAPHKPASMKDVTEEYLNSSTPNSHVVQDLHTYVVNGIAYTVDGHNLVLDYSPHEKEVAELLEKELGGEIFMVPRINEPQGISTPDYLFRGERFDLKSPKGRGKNTLYDALAKKAEQAENFVFDLTRCPLSDEEIDRQLAVIGRSTHTRFVKSIIVVKNGKIIRILKRDEKRS